jgi:TrmH family RNA methyltransferase
MKSETLSSRACIVLVRPEGDANIGAVCRAMKSMGFFSLRLVLPGRRDPDEGQVRTWALGAFDIFEKAERFESLGEALADRDLAAGFTRRTGARRKGRVVALEEFVSLAAGRKYALVFGSESAGLSREELEACTLAVSIPTDTAFPSLNLSHAVQLACYALRNAGPGRETSAGTTSATTRADAESAAARIAADLEEIGFFTFSDSAFLRTWIRDLIQRAGLDREEAGYFEGLFRKIRNLKIHRS